MTDISIRSHRDSDLPFIFNSWLKSYKTRSQFARRITDEVFYQWHKRVIERILGREALVLVATPSDDSNTILGYLVMERQGEQAVIHFAYVKTSFRKLGIAKQLMGIDIRPNERVEFTHWTRDMDWAQEKFKLTYNPYRL